MPFKKTLLFIISAALIVLTLGCSPVKTLNALVPEDHYTRSSAIAYGDSARQKLDVYVPRDVQSELRPIVVFFYGGSWDSGDRADYKFVAEALTSQGFVVVIPDYRVYPEVLFPDFLFDAARVVKWAQVHAAEYGADSSRLFVMGHSAGAHIAAMLALDGQYLASVALKPQDMRGMIGLAGPYDFLPLKKDRLKIIFGPEEQRWKSQPINFVHGDNPPMLLMVGKKDGTVWPRNSYRLAAKIKEAHGPVEVLEFPDWGHIEMVSKLAKPLRQDALLKPIADFIRSN